MSEASHIGAADAEPPGAAQHLDAAEPGSHLPDDVCGTVRRSIVDHEDVGRLSVGSDALEQLTDVLALVERRDDDQGLAHAAHLRGLTRLRGRPCGAHSIGRRSSKRENRSPEATLGVDRARVTMLAGSTERVPPLCPVCGSTAAHLRYRLPHHSIFACQACAQVYLWPLPERFGQPFPASTRPARGWSPS